MNEMAQTIEDLRNAAAAINDAADWLTEVFSGENDKQQNLESAAKKQPEPEKPALTLEEVRAILAEKSRNGYTAQVRELLHKYGAAKLSEVDPKNYEALVRDAEVIGDAT